MSWVVFLFHSDSELEDEYFSSSSFNPINLCCLHSVRLLRFQGNICLSVNITRFRTYKWNGVELKSWNIEWIHNGKFSKDCHKLKFAKPTVVNLRYVNLMNSVRSNNISLKYRRPTPTGCKDIGVRKFKFVTKTQFLCTQKKEEKFCCLFLVNLVMYYKMPAKLFFPGSFLQLYINYTCFFGILQINTIVSNVQ